MEPNHLGPIGGEGGKPFDGYGIPDDARLSAIHIYAEWVIDAIRFDYVAADGATGSRPPVGGLGGFHHVFYLDEDEYLTGISGRCGWYVDNIRLHTNKRVSETYGGEGGERAYELLAPPGYEVAGLFGRCDWYIDALGLWLRPLALREEAAEGAALAAEADAEETAEAAEAELDELMAAVAAEIAAEGQARRGAGVEWRNEALAEVVPDLEAMGGELLSPEEAAALEAASLEELVAALEEEIEAEQQGAGDEDTLDIAVVSLAAAVDSTDDLDALAADATLAAVATLEDMEPGDEESIDLALDSRLDIDPVTGEAYATVTAMAAEVEDWPEDGGDYSGWLDDAEELEATVILRRADVDSDEDVEALEEATMAEALAALQEDLGGEGTADVVVYTQVEEEEGQNVATVMAVASPAGSEEAPAAESAIMISDEIESEDDLLELQDEAIEAAILALEDDLGRELEDADITVYQGVTEDEAGQPYGAVVAVASVPDAAPAAPAAPTRSATGRGSLSSKVVQVGGLEPRPQDLQLVEGIGPKIAALLIEHGINDLGQLAEAPVERLREILAGAGKRFRLADPGTWPRQAALGVAGDWAGLTQLQTELKAGK